MPGQTFDTVPHIILTAHGAMPGGESWSCGLRTTKVEEVTPQATLQTLATACAAAWRSYVITTNSGFSSAVSLSGVTVRQLDTRGITLLQAEGLPVSATVGGESNGLPNQCTMAVSLLTARAGRTGKGRIYVPAQGLSITANGVVDNTYVNSMSSAVQTLVNALNTALVGLTGSPKIGVQSKTAASQLGEGYTGAAVIAVSIGNVVDTQRRRRASMTETYQSKVIA